jgi:hypothetical protein
MLLVWAGMIGLLSGSVNCACGRPAALFGVSTGLWDMFKRRREPIFTKVLLLVFLESVYMCMAIFSAEDHVYKAGIKDFRVTLVD